MDRHQSLQSVESELKNMKDTLKNTYKSLKSAKGNDSNEILMKQL